MAQNNIKKEPDKTFFYQPKEKKKWWQYRKMERKEYGYTALLGLLAGGIIRGVIGDTLATAGMVCGIIWIVKTIQFKIKEKKIKHNNKTL